MDSGAPALTLEERRRTIEEEIENEIEEGGIEDEGGARKEEEDGAGIESIPVISTPAVAAREGEGAGEGEGEGAVAVAVAVATPPLEGTMDDHFSAAAFSDGRILNHVSPQQQQQQQQKKKLRGEVGTEAGDGRSSGGGPERAAPNLPHGGETDDSAAAAESANASDADEDFRKAMAMAELMQTHPHLSPEELSLRASEVVGGAQKKLVEEKIQRSGVGQPKRSSLFDFEETLQKKREEIMAALKETSDGGKEGLQASLRTMQESIRQQQDVAAKNFKDLIKAGTGTGTATSESTTSEEQTPTSSSGWGAGLLSKSASADSDDTGRRQPSPLSPKSHMRVGSLPGLSMSAPLSRPSPKLSPVPAKKSLTGVGTGGLGAAIGGMVDPSKTTAANRWDSKDDVVETMSSIIWKRRSGLGKLQRNAWERRRVVLRGKALFYFNKEDEKDGLAREASQISGLASPSSADDSSSGGTANDSKPTTWWEQTTTNLQKQAAELSEQVNSVLAEGMVTTDPNAPRGMLDIDKEKVTFGATGGHSGAPSPFCISCMARGEAKWILAFETQSLQMKWLAVLTDVVVQQNLEEYNAGLKASESNGAPGYVSNGGSGPSQQTDGAQNVLGFTLSTPVSGTSYFSTPPNGVDKFWRLDGYSIAYKADDGLEESDGESYDDGGSIEATSASPSNVEAAVGGTFSQYLLPSSKFGKEWSLKGDHLYCALFLLNWTIFFSRSSSTSINHFWTAIVVVNVIIWLSLSKAGGLVPEKAATGVQVIEKKKRNKGMKTEEIVPRAGSTLMRVENAEDKPTNNAGVRFNAYRPLPSTSVQVRSHGYSSSRQKIPCPGELYTLAAMDVFESKTQYRGMAKRVKLPTLRFTDSGEKTWYSPDIFVVSVALPTEKPQLGRATDDGFGFTITMYFTMKQETRDILRKVTEPTYDASQDRFDAGVNVQQRVVNGVKLFEEWCRRAPSDPKWQARFKFIPDGNNLEEIGMPGWINKYNAKPVLIKRAGVTGFLFENPEINAMEFDITLHPFPYLAKQATSYMAETYFKQMVASISFVIEGRNDTELPEVLIGQCAQICYPDPAIAPMAEDLFAGKIESSYEGKDDLEATSVPTTSSSMAPTKDVPNTSNSAEAKAKTQKIEVADASALAPNGPEQNENENETINI